MVTLVVIVVEETTIGVSMTLVTLKEVEMFGTPILVAMKHGNKYWITASIIFGYLKTFVLVGSASISTL